MCRVEGEWSVNRSLLSLQIVPQSNPSMYTRTVLTLTKLYFPLAGVGLGPRDFAH